MVLFVHSNFIYPDELLVRDTHADENSHSQYSGLNASAWASLSSIVIILAGRE